MFRKSIFRAYFRGTFDDGSQRKWICGHGIKRLEKKNIN